MRTVLRLISGVVLILLVLYLGAVAYLFVFQRSFVYHPGGTLAQPEAEGLRGVEVVKLGGADGVELTAWFATAAPGRPTLLYFHGNAGNVSDRAGRFRTVVDSGFGLLAVSYRGFPGSTGSPSEAGLFADALLAFDWLASRTPDIVVHGESLGTGVATYVAAQREARALILEAPYTATVDIAAAAYPWVPVAYLMSDQFRSRDMIRDVREPVLIVHGTADTVIPIAYGRQLFELANPPKQLAVIDGARHNNLWNNGLWDTALQFMRAHGLPG